MFDPCRPIQSRVKSKFGAVAAALLMLASASEVQALTTTSNFTVQMTITATCLLTSPSTLDFGTQGFITANVDAQPVTPISVQCTSTTPYNIGLNAGTGSGATVAVRKMTSGGNTINYSLYTTAGRTTVWGNTVGTDTVAATGNGSAQTYNVYGRVPPQTTPPPATYTDTITITVTY